MTIVTIGGYVWLYFSSTRVWVIMEHNNCKTWSCWVDTLANCFVCISLTNSKSMPNLTRTNGQNNFNRKSHVPFLFLQKKHHIDNWTQNTWNCFRLKTSKTSMTSKTSETSSTSKTISCRRNTISLIGHKTLEKVSKLNGYHTLTS